MKYHIAIFASGSGSNALKIIEYFNDRTDVNVSLIVTNSSDAGVLIHARNFNIPSFVISRTHLKDEEFITNTLHSFHINFIVLAGFLLLIPKYLVELFPKKMVNIHPALLPKYGGKGMYGKHVHEAVKQANEEESGMTVHFVNSRFDEGAEVFQKSIKLSPEDSPIEIARKVLTLEHRYFAPAIDFVLTGKEVKED